MEPGPEGPIYMVNLLQFKDHAEYEDGRTTDLSGREAYRIYGREVSKLIRGFGGEITFAGDVTFLALGQVERPVGRGRDRRSTRIERHCSRCRRHPSGQEIGVHRAGWARWSTEHRNRGITLRGLTGSAARQNSERPDSPTWSCVEATLPSSRRWRAPLNTVVRRATSVQRAKDSTHRGMPELALAAPVTWSDVNYRCLDSSDFSFSEGQKLRTGVDSAGRLPGEMERMTGIEPAYLSLGSQAYSATNPNGYLH